MTGDPPTAAAAVWALCTPAAVRGRCHALFDLARNDQLAHFALDLSRLEEVATYTARVTRERYPDLRVPIHGRMAHFDAGGSPKVRALRARLSGRPARERARVLCEVVLISVLLDAGSGPRYRYRETPSTAPIGRSEGLALASLAWLERGGLASDGTPYGVDPPGLLAVDPPALRAAFQVTEDNPLRGVEGRVQLLQGLGRALQSRRDLFGREGRLGGLVDALWDRAPSGEIPAPVLLETLLDGLSGIWPGRLSLAGIALGDVWRHPAARGPGLTDGLVPFHKLSQWLALSLVEPLAESGLRVRDLNGLTGLAEYRNGGLFLDSGVIVPRRPDALLEAHPVDSLLVVEWRALTVALLDRIADPVREALGIRDPAAMPLPAILEGGTWAAGRQLAQERRAGGDSPIEVLSDGTVF